MAHPDATRRWSDYRYGATSAVLSFDVINSTAGEDAKTKTGYDLNTQHPENQEFLVDDWNADQVGFKLFRVTFSFSVPEDGATHPPDGEPNPLTLPPRIMWEVGEVSEPVDRDADGNELVNSALDPFDPPPLNEFTALYLRVTRFEPAPFDVQKALRFSNKVNAGQMTVQGMTITAGQMLCRSITPVSDYNLNAKHLEVAYNFELRADGFDFRLLDQGMRGWRELSNQSGYKVPTELFHTKNVSGSTPSAGQQITGPVRLNGRGRPFENTGQNVYVGEESSRLVELAAPPIGAELENKTKAVFLKYKRKKSENLVQLGL